MPLAGKVGKVGIPLSGQWVGKVNRLYVSGDLLTLQTREGGAQ